MSDDAWYKILEDTHKAVRVFARIEVEGLSRKVIHSLQRQHSSGIFGDDYIYKTLWDEYCHEVQEGPHDALESAWELTIGQVVDDIIERIPRHVAVLLSIFAAWELCEGDEPELVGSIWTDGLNRVLQRQLAEDAGVRNLHRFGPWRNY